MKLHAIPFCLAQAFLAVDVIAYAPISPWASAGWIVCMAVTWKAFRWLNQ